MNRLAPLLAALALSACGSTSRMAPTSTAATLECVPFARAATGIQLYGDAHTWWDQAPGHYERSQSPVPGGVLVFRRTARLNSGHVSVVRRVVSDREITVSQANWVHRRITRDEPVLDVSPGNDWTAVRVWWAPSGSLGASTYPTYGFIAPTRERPARSGLVASLP